MGMQWGGEPLHRPHTWQQEQGSQRHSIAQHGTAQHSTTVKLQGRNQPARTASVGGCCGVGV